MTKSADRPRAGRAQPLSLPEDPDAAFRARAARDRARLMHLAARLGEESAWSRIAAPLAEIEHLAHGLAGAGGVFGYDRLSAAAAKLERLAERWRKARLSALSPRRKALLARAVGALVTELAVVGDEGAASPE